MRKPVERLEEKLLKENLWIFLMILLSEKKRKRSELRSLVEKRFYFLPGQVTSYKVLFLLAQDGYVSRDENKRYSATDKGKKQLREAKKLLKNTVKLLD
jgi:PadR family transcriptional regulator, regulatory protein PadR